MLAKGGFRVAVEMGEIRKTGMWRVRVRTYARARGSESAWRVVVLGGGVESGVLLSVDIDSGVGGDEDDV